MTCRPHHPDAASRLLELSRPAFAAHPRPLRVRPQLCSARPHASAPQSSRWSLSMPPAPPLLGTGLSGSSLAGEGTVAGLSPPWLLELGQPQQTHPCSQQNTHKSEEGRTPAWGSWPQGFRHLQPREARLGPTSQGVAGCQRQSPPASPTLLFWEEKLLSE